MAYLFVVATALLPIALSQSIGANPPTQCPVAVTNESSLRDLVVYLADDGHSADARFECAQRSHAAAQSSIVAPPLRFRIAEAWVAATFHLVPAVEAGEMNLGGPLRYEFVNGCQLGSGQRHRALKAGETGFRARSRVRSRLSRINAQA